MSQYYRRDSSYDVRSEVCRWLCPWRSASAQSLANKWLWLNKWVGNGELKEPTPRDREGVIQMEGFCSSLWKAERSSRWRSVASGLAPGSFASPTLGFQAGHRTQLPITGVLGIQTQVLTLGWQAFYSLSHLVSSRIHLKTLVPPSRQTTRKWQTLWGRGRWGKQKAKDRTQGRRRRHKAEAWKIRGDSQAGGPGSQKSDKGGQQSNTWQKSGSGWPLPDQSGGDGDQTTVTGTQRSCLSLHPSLLQVCLFGVFICLLPSVSLGGNVNLKTWSPPDVVVILALRRQR